MQEALQGSYMKQRPTNSEGVIAEIRSRSPNTLLAFSCGKDSIAAWLAIREKFDRIVPFYMYLVPGNLEFIEEALDYYERFFETKIVRMPSDAIYRMLNACVFQPPERVRVIERLDLQEPDRQDIAAAVAWDAGLDADETFTAIGVRQNDSIQRRLSIQKHGAINENSRHYYPVYDWSKDRLIDAIKHAGCKLPVDYKIFGRSFDGIDLRFIYQVKKHFPRDYQRILDWYPLVEVEIYRYEFAMRGHQ
jgi:3'-phosphoadenosine 5'-phosphosulfate sulfotransferase (PAPS reductase)/FAD synthetase